MSARETEEALAAMQEDSRTRELNMAYASVNVYTGALIAHLKKHEGASVVGHLALVRHADGTTATVLAKSDRYARKDVLAMAAGEVGAALKSELTGELK